MPTLIETVAAMLEAGGMPFARDEGAGASLVRVPWEGRGDRLEAILEGWDEARRLKVYVYCPVRVPPEVRGLVGEFLHRANWGLSFGSFEVHPDTGAVRFRAGTIADGETLDGAALGTLVEGSLWVVDAHLPALRSVIDGVATPAEAEEEAAALLRKRAG